MLDEPDTYAERRGIVRAPGDLTRIALTTRTCRLGERDDFALDLLAHILAGGRSSRLHQRLVLDEEVATYVGTHNEPRLDPGLFWIAAELRPGADPERAEALVREELARLCTDGIGADELKRARVQVRAAFLFEDETCLDTAQRIGRFALLARGGHRLLDEALATLDSLGRRELRDVATRLFAPERWTAVWSLPRDVAVPRPGTKRRTVRKRKAKVAVAEGRSGGVKTVPAPARGKAVRKPKKSAKKNSAKKNSTTKPPKRRTVKRRVAKPSTGRPSKPEGAPSKNERGSGDSGGSPS